MTEHKTGTREKWLAAPSARPSDDVDEYLKEETSR
jgi:hypothetical protein